MWMMLACASGGPGQETGLEPFQSSCPGLAPVDVPWHHTRYEGRLDGNWWEFDVLDPDQGYAVRQQRYFETHNSYTYDRTDRAVYDCTDEGAFLVRIDATTVKDDEDDGITELWFTWVYDPPMLVMPTDSTEGASWTAASVLHQENAFGSESFDLRADCTFGAVEKWEGDIGAYDPVPMTCDIQDEGTDAPQYSDAYFADGVGLFAAGTYQITEDGT